MAKWCNDLVMDAALSYIRTNSTLMVACPSQPATFAAAQSSKLCEVAMVSGDFTIADGSVSGRKVTVGAKSGIAILAGGDATHVALLDVPNSALIYVTTDTLVTLPVSGTVNISAWAIEIGDPV